MKYQWTRLAVNANNAYTQEVLPMWKYDYRRHLVSRQPHECEPIYQIIQFRDELGRYYVRDVRTRIEGYAKATCIRPPYKTLAEAKRVVEMLLAMEGERI